jgi:DNA-binding MarR family transcriptional regulator
MENKDISLNDNDEKLLAFCDNRERTVGEISDYLNIRPSSVSLRLQKLEALKLVVVNRGGIGKKTLVRRKESVKKEKKAEIKMTCELLKQLKNKGEMTQEEYMATIPIDPENKLSYGVPLRLLYSMPKLVQQYVKITPKGLKFLEQNSSE